MICVISFIKPAITFLVFFFQSIGGSRRVRSKRTEGKRIEGKKHFFFSNLKLMYKFDVSLILYYVYLLESSARSDTDSDSDSDDNVKRPSKKPDDKSSIKS